MSNVSNMPTHLPSNYAGKGLTGLVNMGNTCFINSCMQILSHTYELNDILNTPGFLKRIKRNNDAQIMTEWNTLRLIMWKQNCIVEPGKFIHTMQNVAKVKGLELFTGFSQNDISEFMLFIIDCLHNSVSRPVNMNINGETNSSIDKIAVKVFSQIKAMYSTEYSEIWNLFYGMHISQIISCKTGMVLSHTPEPFFNINLSIPNKSKIVSSLYECFDHYVSGERLDGENQMKNEETGEYEDVDKNLTYWSLPTIMAIDIKRFDSSGRKNQNLVSFPITNLDMRKYVIGYQKETCIYDLYGVCNHHSNSAFGGHYTASIKNANGKWYHYDDSSISAITNPNSIITSMVYCLFYRKKGIYTSNI